MKVTFYKIKIYKQATLGIIAATTVVFVWSAWLVLSSIGAQSNLTVFDLAAIRYGMSALILLPFIL